MFNKEKEIEFVREFTSPVFGNVYVTKRVKTDAKNADKMIRSGLAVSVVNGKAQMNEKQAIAGTVVVSGKPPVEKDPYKGMTAAQKKAAIKAEEEAQKKKVADEARADELLAKAESEEGLTEEETAELKALGFTIEEGSE